MPREAYKPKKLFSLKEANGTLPLVTRIIEDIVRLSGELRELHEKAERLAEAGRSVQAEEARDRIHGLVHEAADLADELDAVGCICKDPAVGLVDFPAKIAERIVFLCWKLGEEQILYWHEIEGGFAGRKPVQGVFA